MVNDSSLGAVSGEFDLDTQGGIMQLLASIRMSELATDEKAELRDLVFLFTNGGRDVSVKQALLQKVATHKLQPVSPLPAVAQTSVAVVPEPSRPTIGSIRRAPQFVAPTQPRPASVPVQKQPEVKVATDTETQPSPATEVTSPTNSPETTIPPSLEVSQPEPVTEQVHTSEPSASEIATNAGVATPPPAPVGAEGALERIRQIKATVNERIGNPVNLIDINNDVGREYMSALLDAMKRASGGGSAESAMERLERAFTAVEQVISEHEKTASKPPAPIASAPDVPPTPPDDNASVVPTSLPTQFDTSANTAMNEAEVSEAPESKTPEVEPLPSYTSTPRTIEVKTAPDTTESLPPTPPPVVTPTIEERKEQEPEPAENAAVVPPLSSPMTPAPVPTETVPTEQPSPHVTPPAVPLGSPPPRSGLPTTGAVSRDLQAPVSAADLTDPVTAQVARKRFSSLAESNIKLRTPDELPDASSLETSSVAGDPLFTKEVDTGLNQLLSEWSLFKKSGLFGTGPKGIEHPLFIKIKDVQIPLLLAGRFEGATQEIKQSITDYMNGWRYEQGIIYEQGETFERYLRRVIRHILDLQKV